MERYNTLAMEGGFGACQVPLYPLLLRFIYLLFGALNFTPLSVIQGALSSLVVPLMCFVATRTWGGRAGIAAAVMSAVYPDFLFSNTTVHTKIYALFELGWDRGVMHDIVGGEGRAHVVTYAYLAIFVFGFLGLARSYRETRAPLVAPVLSYVILTILLSIFVIRFRALVEPLLIAYAAVFFGGAPRESEPISPAKPKVPRRA